MQTVFIKKKALPLWIMLLAFIPILSSCKDEMDGEEAIIRNVEISGSVTNEAGEPVDNALLTLRRISFTHRGTWLDSEHLWDDYITEIHTNAAGKYLKDVDLTIYAPEDPGKEFGDSLWVICEPPVDYGLQKDSVILVLKKSFPYDVDQVKYDPATVNFILK